jgi:hypothetical protein
VAKRSKGTQTRGIPSEVEILEFVRESKVSVGKREIARAFGIKGADKIELKKLLRAMSEEGKLNRRGRRLRGGGALPDVTVIQVTSIDRDGELIAVPVEWDELSLGKPPRILVRATKPGPQAGRGDRILAKIRPPGDSTYGYEGRVIRKLSGEDNRVLGVYRIAKGIGDESSRSTRRPDTSSSSGREMKAARFQESSWRSILRRTAAAGLLRRACASGWAISRTSATSRSSPFTSTAFRPVFRSRLLPKQQL